MTFWRPWPVSPLQTSLLLLLLGGYGCLLPTEINRNSPACVTVYRVARKKSVKAATNGALEICMGSAWLMVVRGTGGEERADGDFDCIRLIKPRYRRPWNVQRDEVCDGCNLIRSLWGQTFDMDKLRPLLGPRRIPFDHKAGIGKGKITSRQCFAYESFSKEKMCFVDI